MDTKLTTQQLYLLDRQMMHLKSMVVAGSRDPETVKAGLQAIIDARAGEPPELSPLHTTPGQAATIMGDNFHGIDALERHMGVKLSAESREQFSTVPFSAELLLACRETHLLVACGALSPKDVREALKDQYAACHDPWWYGVRPPWATQKVDPGWQLVCKHQVSDSCGKTWNAQCHLLAADDQMPSISVLVQALSIHCLEADELPEVGTVRVSEPGVIVYYHASGAGFWLDTEDTQKTSRDIGLASSKKYS